MGKIHKKNFKDDIIAYRCIFEKCDDIQEIIGCTYDNLPDTLIIKPGNYLVYNKIFSLNKDGVYRFIDSFKKAEQRVVWTRGGV